ncbi:MAG: phosphatase PAP2 family protein, partial [bacterium]|nr:phosphatase PAP2 family protein [bacterium]
MTTRQRLLKGLLFLLNTGYYIGGYLGVNALNQQRGIFHDLTLPGEASIPFVPFFLTGYTAIFLLVIYLYLIIDSFSFFKRTAAAFAICVSIHLPIFLLFPVRYNLRAVFDPSGSWLLEAMDFYYWIDLPYNCFPSLHVGMAFLCMFLLHRYNKKRSWPLVLLALFISSSVVLVKQHYILDIAGAIPLAYLS